jgi:hypothetical protein
MELCSAGFLGLPHESAYNCSHFCSHVVVMQSDVGTKLFSHALLKQWRNRKNVGTKVDLLKIYIIKYNELFDLFPRFYGVPTITI